MFILKIAKCDLESKFFCIYILPLKLYEQYFLIFFNLDDSDIPLDL